ncbi:MAG: formate dehydrogenase accessory sulfurtransferase FdhD [Gemmatimonadetes bacterium]|nr:formate dehydrogenase accessory sulfurtransferase FdhD [Gemmatimonadota bacterium]MBT8404243.1 formate dehydrogenase accessory sulfurtransferase FdhD [Gemmatimonadota bacterium]NNF39243.1 formate dehydrogenase accessory sulfurtransferase FdhD [Gemmatimonadota bacterium]
MARPARSTTRVPVIRLRDGRVRRTRDVLSLEEPLEMRVRPHGADAGVSIAVTMRTPGHDFELVAGFLLTEGVLASRLDLAEMTYCRSGEGPQEYNIVEARLRPGIEVDLERLTRNVFTSSSCGVCGKASIEALEIEGCAPFPLEGTVRLDADRLASLPERLREHQRDFERTGGLHAAALADGSGTPDAVHEDVGRHNAVDKVLGAALLAGRLPAGDRVLVVSGRASFEIIQKAVAAGVPAVVAVGAPSSLAVDTARRFNVTLAGFTRDGGFNLYTGEERVTLPLREDA